MKHATAVILSVLASLAAAPLALGGAPITIGEVVGIPSRLLDEERTLLISTPANYRQSQARFPVLYMTDGEAHLTHTRGTADFLSRAGVMPDLIIVGIPNTDRTRDLSPTHAFRTLQDGSRQEIGNSGGAGRFLDFIEKEVIPYVEGHYRTAPFRILAGHSLGGLFALHALVSRPDLFNAYIVASPALGWDNDYILGKVETFLKSRAELRCTLFLSMADEEARDAKPTRSERLAAVFGTAKVPGLVWVSVRMPEEEHGTVVLRTHYWGLRKIFDGWRLPADPSSGEFTGSLAELKEHYAGLAQRFGVAILPPERIVNQVGYQRLGHEDVEGAIVIFRYNVELYPDSANVYDSLGEALERTGRHEEALASFEKAVKNGKKANDPLLDAFIRNRDRAAAIKQEKAPK
jgi:predicted alpha/beta superfamily hydrolase